MTKEVKNIEEAELYAIIKSKVSEVINMSEKEIFVMSTLAPIGTLNTYHEGHLLGFTTTFTFHKFPKFIGTVGGNPVVTVDGRDRDSGRVALELTKAIKQYTKDLDERIHRVDVNPEQHKEAVRKLNKTENKEISND